MLQPYRTQTDVAIVSTSPPFQAALAPVSCSAQIAQPLPLQFWQYLYYHCIWQLTGSELAVVNKIQCGFINNRWIPGKLKQGNMFYSYSSSLKLAVKQLKTATTTNQKAKLILQIEALKKRIKAGNKTCKAAASLTTPTPTSTPTPTTTPTPSPTPTVIPPNAVNILWTQNATTLRGQNGPIQRIH